MIRLIQEGSYELIETKTQTKLLILDSNKNYAWINAGDIGEILVGSKRRHRTDSVLARGRYRIYDVKDEDNLTDLKHLELFVGEGEWQGYLLPLGLPNGVRKRRIVPTPEIITKSLN